MRIRLDRDQVTRKMAEGERPIALGRVSGTGDRGLLISVFQLKPGEERIVGNRLAEILKESTV